MLADYRRSDFPHDLAAGLSVTAVAVPMAVANAQLAGLAPATGLYASMLPLVAYALFGTSRHLMVGPSAAAAAIVAAAAAPLAAGDAARYYALVTAVTFIAGALCIGASFLRVGAIADFLSKPILIGFLNGVGISVVLSQIGILFGFSLAGSGIVPRALEFAGNLPQTHWPTLLVGLGTIAMLVVWPRLVPRVPAALVAMVAAGAVVSALGLANLGVSTIGPVSGGWPAPRLPSFAWSELPLLVAEAAGLSLVLFSTLMINARSFAARHGYDVDADREMAALGAANLASALTQGFAVNGTSSRTAVGEAAGGRTQAAGIVSAVAVAVILLAFTWPLQFIPTVALAGVLVMAGISLLGWSELATIRRIDRREFWLAIVAMVGVVAVGVMNAILVAVVLAILNFVKIVSRPKVEILGRIPGQPGFHAVERHPEAATRPGLMLFRFNGPIIFFSSPYFKREVQRAAAAAGPGLRWFVIDLLPVTMIDATGHYTIQDVLSDLRSRGVVVAAAARETEWSDWAADRGFAETLAKIRFYATLQQATEAYDREVDDRYG